MTTWAKEPVKKKETYTPKEIAEWDEIVRIRRERLQPACSLTGEQALALMKKGVYEQHKSELGIVTILWIPKADGRLRLTYIASDFDDENILADVVANDVVAKFDDAAVQAVYWFSDDVLGKTGDGRIFAGLAKRVDELLADTFKVSWKGDGANVIWEVSR